MLDPHRLRLLRAVVQAGSMSAAGDSLGLSTSAISQHLATLARETGLTLLERSGRGVEPTSAALVLVQESTEILDRLQRLDRVVDELRTGRSLKLHIGYFPSAGAVWMPQVAQRLREQLPEVAIEMVITEGAPRSVELAQDLNIVSETLTEEASATPSGFARHVLGQDGYAAVLPAHHSLAARTEIRMAELADDPWVDPALGVRSSSNTVLRQAQQAAGFTPRYVVQTEDHVTAMAFVAAGTGVTVLPLLATRQAVPGVVIVPVVAPTPQRRIVAHLRRGDPYGPAALALELLREVIGEASGAQSGNPRRKPAPRT